MLDDKYLLQPINGFLAYFVLINLAIFPEVVVFPEPCNPTIIITVGFLLKSTSETSSPNKCTNSSCTILTKTCPGFNEPTTSAPIAFSFVDAINSFTTYS